MRKIFKYLIILILISCKTEPKKPIELRINSNGIEIHESTIQKSKIDCALFELKKTVNYKNEIKKYVEFNRDTIIEIEQKKIGNINYRTVFYISDFEDNLWFIVEKENKTDSVLIHYEDYVEYLYVVESEFNINKCEIAISETEFSMDGKTEKTEIKIIKL